MCWKAVERTSRVSRKLLSSDRRMENHRAQVADWGEERIGFGPYPPDDDDNQSDKMNGLFIST